MSSLADLRLRHRGPVIAPDDSGYDAARGTFNGMLDRRPELVTRPLDVDDVAAAVGYAVEGIRVTSCKRSRTLKCKT
jgi:hypothetical protein